MKYIYIYIYIKILILSQKGSTSYKCRENVINFLGLAYLLSVLQRSCSFPWSQEKKCSTLHHLPGCCLEHFGPLHTHTYIYIYIYIYIYAWSGLIYIYEVVCGCQTIYIYIYSLSSTDCFVLSELFSVARHAGLTLR